MPVKKIKVEVFDESGNKYTISVEGKVNRNNAVKILDIVELLGGIPLTEINPKQPKELTKIEKVRSIVEKHFSLVNFSAREAQKIYNNEFREEMDLSTISTYLTRLSNIGVLIKEKRAQKVTFRLATNELNILKT
ncbi:MAG: hypothetical protein QXR42_03680 [Candidatus Bathyarchaeia archaeon]